MVFVVRNDLKMGKGKIAAQVAHAAVSNILLCLSNNKWREIMENWLNEGQPKVVLKVESEVELMEIYKKALELRLPVSLIEDAGKTQLEPGTKTCIGIGPYDSSTIDSITRKLKLL